MSLLQEEREIVLGNEYAEAFDFAEVNEFVRTADKSLFISHHYQSGKGMLIQPRGGFPTYKKQFALWDLFIKSYVDVLPLTIDSNTRLNDYATSRKMLRLSEENDVDMLNGYPLVTHGYRTTRKMVTHFNKPVSLRHGTPDARLLIETAIASGIFDIEGGPITYLLPYSKNFPLDKAFLYWKYVERVCANYSALNEPINRESFGALTATLVPPAITIVIQLLEMLLSLEEGVKSFSVSFSQTGSMLQDIVTGAVIKKLARHYAEQAGCGDAAIHLVYHQWMGAFPCNQDYAEQLINLATVIAAMVGASKIITKTREEASGIPTKEANAKTVANTRYTLGILHGLPQVVDAQEEEILTAEVMAIMEAVFNDKADTLWRKIFNSIKAGIIDVPFSPHIINHNELITVRDANRNIRIIQRGRVPIPDRCYAFERAQCDLSKDTTSIVGDIVRDIGIMQGIMP